MFNIPAAVPASSAADFDFLLGQWQVHNRRLRERQASPACSEWDEFPAMLSLHKALLGLANVERYTANLQGQDYEGMALRLFDPATKLWTIYWISSNAPVMDTHPVVGSFDGDIGRFYARHAHPDGDRIVLYQWDKRDPQRPIWSQAISIDEGQQWEWNWFMDLSTVSELVVAGLGR
jgi:hypothetical protein